MKWEETGKKEASVSITILYCTEFCTIAVAVPTMTEAAYKKAFDWGLAHSLWEHM